MPRQPLRELNPENPVDAGRISNGVTIPRQRPGLDVNLEMYYTSQSVSVEEHELYQQYLRLVELQALVEALRAQRASLLALLAPASANTEDAENVRPPATPNGSPPSTPVQAPTHGWTRTQAPRNAVPRAPARDTTLRLAPTVAARPAAPTTQTADPAPTRSLSRHPLSGSRGSGTSSRLSPSFRALSLGEIRLLR